MLVNCVAYRQGRKLADLPVQRIGEYLKQPDTFVWVALKDATAEELAEMQAEFGLHELAVEDAHHGHQRPKIEEYGDSVFVVMHLLEIVDGELVQGEVNVFVDEGHILSVRNRAAQTFLGVRDRAEREPHLLSLGSAYVLYALMDAVVDRYFPVLDALETELEEIEEHIFDRERGGSPRANIERLYALKRKVMVLKHAVAPLMEAVSKLYGGRVPRTCANLQEYFRDIYDHLTRLNSSIDTARDTIGTAIQVNLSMVTIEESEVNKRLAAWAGIFAVATAFAGIWGMNFEFMPELKWKYGYPLALLLMGGICGLLYWRFKKSGWL
ncbi:MAG TPA: magnesium/cobalt transporter CorA [Ferrovibrio sp.]|jgi:magnesium transporter|uniref:magnesium/cobalt transporter CorA n=1 Tax=Ferrovibrio sp. TaxID=1917215 RepID=UPI002B4B4187|nr:magnesium/cobalt transporter CorA [Ferrovibrio sp.]HLT76794.1 magnesium/cobalt transporter CorA [Ferrovibrio sp.]